MDKLEHAPSEPVPAKNNLDLKYQEVRQVYTLWRRAEAALQQKTKELNEFRDRAAQLKAAHLEFSTKLGAIESLKQLSVQLQDQIAELNVNLSESVDRERRLSAQNEKLETQIARMGQDQVVLKRQIMELTGALDESKREQFRLGENLKQSQEVVSQQDRQRQSIEQQQQDNIQQIDKLLLENSNLRTRSDMLENRMSSLSRQLEEAAGQVETLFKTAQSNKLDEFKEVEIEQEIEQLRADNSRLIHLLFSVPQYKQFRLTWNDSVGLAFVGPGKKPALDHGNHHGRGQTDAADVDGEEAEVSYGPWFKTSLSELGQSLSISDEHADESKQTHFQRGWNEFMTMAASYPSDPFPADSPMQELSVWVPRSVAKVGKAFLDHTSLPKDLIHDFIRKTNQTWYSRELRHAKRVQGYYKAQLKDLQRQMQHAIPYSNVIAVKKVQRLEQELRQERARKHKPHSKAMSERVNPDSDPIRDVESLASMEQLSKEQMLRASLSSLDQLSKRMNAMSKLSEPRPYPDECSPTAFNFDDMLGMPSPQFINGALWISRNLAVLVEDLGEHINKTHEHSKQTVSEALQESRDPEHLYRLLLLHLSSLISDIDGGVLDCRINFRSAIQSLTKLKPGDSSTLLAVDQSLPLRCLPESVYESKQSPRPLSPTRKSNNDASFNELLNKIQHINSLVQKDIRNDSLRTNKS